MAKNSSAVMENTPQVVEAPVVVTKNRTVTFHAFATKELSTRRSYKIEGHAGCLVIERALFADGDGPLSITLDCDLVEPTVKVGAEEKAAAALAKATERAEKAKARVEEQQRKAEERAAKAQQVLDAAKAKLAAGSPVVE